LVPFSGRSDLRRTESIDAQADRRTPGNRVLHKLHLLSVVSEQERTRSFQALLGDDVRVRVHAKFGADSAVRPDCLHDVRLGLFSQSKMKLRAGDRLLLHQQPGANFNFAADPERVDALVADGLYRVRPNDLPSPFKSAASKTKAGPAGWSSSTKLPLSSPSQISTRATPDGCLVGARKRSSAPLLSRSATWSRTSPARFLSASGTVAISAMSQLSPSFLSEIRMMAPSACTARRSRTPSLFASATAIALTSVKPAGSGRSRNWPCRSFIKTCSRPAPSMMAASGLPSPSRSAQANPTAP